jgi:aspartyl-tRNA(Asn)/glutamyl-tRNA(Gln) amidotransferase subunit A
MVADPEVMAALDEVERVLRQEGAEVRTIALPRLQELAAVQRIILLAETWAVHAKWLRERPEDYSTPCRRKVMPGAFLSAGDYVQAQQWRGRMIDAVDDAFRDVDVLLTASAMDPPFRIDDTGPCENLSPPGPQPLQSHRASSDCDAERHFEDVRVATIGTVRRTCL